MQNHSDSFYIRRKLIIAFGTRYGLLGFRSGAGPSGSPSVREVRIGDRIIVRADVETAALTRVLKALSRRPVHVTLDDYGPRVKGIEAEFCRVNETLGSHIAVYSESLKVRKIPCH